MRFATKAVHVGQEADPTTGATIPPIYATSTYTQAAPGEHKGFEYSRTQNPTRHGLQDCLAALEGGEAVTILMVPICRRSVSTRAEFEENLKILEGRINKFFTRNVMLHPPFLGLSAYAHLCAH